METPKIPMIICALIGAAIGGYFGGVSWGIIGTGAGAVLGLGIFLLQFIGIGAG